MSDSRKPYRKLTRLGTHSAYVVIPAHILKELGWRERQKLTVKRSGKKIVIQDWKKS
jgi:antitoxin component of MazEF toxin-antitoxin module